METPLFSYLPQQDAEILKSNKDLKKAALVMCPIFAIFLLLISLGESHSTGSAIFCLLSILLAIFLGGLMYIGAIGREKQYLLIYDDRSCYRKGFFKKGREIRLDPGAYKIKVKKEATRAGFFIYLIFTDQRNRCLLRYMIPYTENQKRRLKYRLYGIGCKIIAPKNGF